MILCNLFLKKVKKATVVGNQRNVYWLCHVNKLNKNLKKLFIAT